MTVQDVLYILTTELLPQQTALGSTSKLKQRPVFRFFRLFSLTQGQMHKKGRRPCFQTIPSHSKQSCDPSLDKESLPAVCSKELNLSKLTVVCIPEMTQQ